MSRGDNNAVEDDNNNDEEMVVFVWGGLDGRERERRKDMKCQVGRWDLMMSEGWGVEGGKVEGVKRVKNKSGLDTWIVL